MLMSVDRLVPASNQELSLKKPCLPGPKLEIVEALKNNKTEKMSNYQSSQQVFRSDVLDPENYYADHCTWPI